jgi:hypothetical protein
MNILAPNDGTDGHAMLLKKARLDNWLAGPKRFGKPAALSPRLVLQTKT